MEKLKTHIKKQKMTQSAMAIMAGVTKGYISQLSSGKRRPSLDVALRIDEVTEGGVSVYDWREGGVK